MYVCMYVCMCIYIYIYVIIRAPPPPPIGQAQKCRHKAFCNVNDFKQHNIIYTEVYVDTST